ncbi:unnamed protein product [Cylindrotheca closterium]|uniref:Impact N-terminal domain-containing protein n=1 Tax=Cylindrotheca closterium TaxID=2856 RepID=A0AAD2CF50_9STRA|nr:unnamed protein product [Cylindrotheca closterium]
MVSESDEDAARRDEEWGALIAFYGDDLVSGGSTLTTQTPTSMIPDELSKTAKGSSFRYWNIQVMPPNVTLELGDIPRDYPSGPNPPKPKLKAPQWIMDETRQEELEHELLTLFQSDTEVAIMWVEHCRSAIEEYQEANQAFSSNNDSQQADHHDAEGDEDPTTTIADNNNTNDDGSYEPPASSVTISFVPGSKFGQSIRHFQLSVVDNPAYQREVFHGAPFHPPKSGPSETMQSHVASVSCMEHVDWVLHHLLFDVKKVDQASHNMIAYRFTDQATGRLVSDSDDDGEKGSGSKLASLLELTGVEDCIVVVSRWYGGVHLGPARFKWIAAVGRQGLEDAGFLKKIKDEDSSTTSKHKKGGKR